MKGFLADLLLCKGSMVRKSFFRFGWLSLAAVFARRDRTGAPVPNLVLRVGIAGCLDLPERAELEPLIDSILSQLQQGLAKCSEAYRDTFRHAPQNLPVECRLLTQLAAGADQFVADRAARLGFQLQCIFPISKSQYAEDLRRNPGADADPVRELERLSQGQPVLELDGEIDADSHKLTDQTYENSALTMLDHSDMLLALVRSDAKSISGGTRWLVEEAELRGIPVVEVFVDRPELSALSTGIFEARIRERLDIGGWATGLVKSLVLLPETITMYQQSGWFVEKFRSRVKAMDSEWPPNWSHTGEAAQTESQVQIWMDTINRDYFEFWRWAEHRANTYRDLYQGAYVTVGLLALTAVVGALLGALDESWSPFGKWIELVSIAALLLLWWDAHSGNWRQRWLGYRWLEQQISDAAVLELVGRTIPVKSSPFLSEFEKEGAWIQWYLRAVLRQAHLPTGKLDQKNMLEAGKLILAGKIDRQLAYYEKAEEANRRTHHRLEAVAMIALALTLITAIAYLCAHYLEESFHVPATPLRLIATAAGIFCPALAATLAAIRAQGEFVQLETRYKGMKRRLSELRKAFQTILEEGSAKPMPLLSWRLARHTKEAAGWMLEEVSQWRSLLQTKEIEHG